MKERSPLLLDIALTLSLMPIAEAVAMHEQQLDSRQTVLKKMAEWRHSTIVLPTNHQQKSVF